MSGDASCTIHGCSRIAHTRSDGQPWCNYHAPSDPRDFHYWTGRVVAALTPESAPILAAVLAEVARQDAGGLVAEEIPAFDEEIFRAALAIREARRLRMEGK